MVRALRRDQAPASQYEAFLKRKQFLVAVRVPSQGPASLAGNIYFLREVLLKAMS